MKDVYGMYNKKITQNITSKDCFGALLKYALKLFCLDYKEIADELHVSSEAFRQWLRGRNFPSVTYLTPLYDILETHINNHASPALANALKTEIKKQLNNLHEDMLDMTGYEIGSIYVNALKLIYAHRITTISKQNIEDEKTISSGYTKVVFFDFDGTLTDRKIAKTTWESIWTALGYDVEECRKLHARYNKKEITHSEWCKLTEDKFIERNLRKDVLTKIANNIQLVNGCEETLAELRRRNIKVFIVSGSILYIIQEVLGSILHYVDEIKANDFLFDNNGVFTHIIGTKYDFEGKAEYISEKTAQLNISMDDVLFIGNSFNDKYAYRSGAKTLCVNPDKTDISDTMIWNSCIEDCKNLMDVLRYIK